MAVSKFVLAVILASATLAVVIANTVGNIALILKAGPTPVLSIVAMILAAATVIISWRMKSHLLAGLLAVSGIIFMIPALSAMGYSFQTIIFPGPILGIIFGLVILGFGLEKAIRTSRAARGEPQLSI
jgi:O-antigen/teichoic acid export membrane protein